MSFSKSLLLIVIVCLILGLSMGLLILLEIFWPTPLGVEG
jgi:hypothetical protein